MNGSLRAIAEADWAARATAAGWCVNELSAQCNVSVSGLERYFHDTKGQCPRDWLNDERMRQAGELLRSGMSVKEAAGELGYHGQHGFSLAFKKHHGYPPKMHWAKANSKNPRKFAEVAQ